MQQFMEREIRRLHKERKPIMGRIIAFEDLRKRKLNEDRIEELELEMCDVIGCAEIYDDDTLDAISEAKCDEIERLIRLEYLKAGYKFD